MGIDKIKKKKKKKPNQLVSKRKDGKRPGYYGSDEGFGDYDDSPSSSSSSDNSSSSSDDNYMDYYSAPAPAPSYSVQDDIGDYATNVGSTASVGGGFDDDSDDIQDDLTDYATNVMKTADPKGGFEDDGDDGESLYVSPTQIMKEKEPYIDYKPGPNYVTADELSNLERGLGDADQRAATLANIQAVNPIQKAGFFDSGIGKLAKNVGMAMIPGLLPAQLGNLYGQYNLAKGITKGANYLTRGRTPTLPSVAELYKNRDFRPGSGGKPPAATGFDDNDSGSNNIIAKNVVASNIEKYSPKQINSLQSNISLLESVLDSGQYRGTKLNNSQLSKVSSQRNSLLEQYNMIQEYLV